jgi:hypothetical protein
MMAVFCIFHRQGDAYGCGSIFELRLGYSNSQYFGMASACDWSIDLPILVPHFNFSRFRKLKKTGVVLVLGVGDHCKAIA